MNNLNSIILTLLQNRENKENTRSDDATLIEFLYNIFAQLSWQYEVWENGILQNFHIRFVQQGFDGIYNSITQVFFTWQMSQLISPL